MHIKQYSEQEQVEFKAKHYLAEPRSWAVMDGSTVFSWYATEEEAKVGLQEANMEEEVFTEFDSWVEEQARKYRVSEATIKSIIR